MTKKFLLEVETKYKYSGLTPQVRSLLVKGRTEKCLHLYSLPTQTTELTCLESTCNVNHP